jgi:hypothetical protein
MHKLASLSITSTLLLLLGLAACSPEKEPRLTPEEKAQMEAPGVNFHGVATIIRENNLRSVPEVEEESRRHIAMFESGQMGREQAATLFHGWLVEWMQKNPETLARARAGSIESDAPTGASAEESEPAGP